MRAARFVPALVLVALAVVVALLAADVRAWQHAFEGNGQAKASTRLPWNVAARALTVGDDVQARRAIALFRATASVHGRLDNALGVTAARANAETALAAVARGRGARASQAATLLGVLAFGDLARGGGRDSSQAETAVGDFENAIRAEPSDANAKYDLELLLRSLAARGVRTGPGAGSGAGATGHKGAGSGTPGQGY
jgi:hypothetical protein